MYLNDDNEENEDDSTELYMKLKLIYLLTSLLLSSYGHLQIA